jgi:murein DD-endopeptidase MepM/ murein hydrolase activator NlpD
VSPVFALCAAVATAMVLLPATTASAGPGGESTSNGPASAGVSSDQAQVNQLEQRIEHDGAVVQQLVTSYNQTQSHEDAVQAQLNATQAHLAADRAAETKAKQVLREIAIETYVSGEADDSAALAPFETTSANSVAAEHEYSEIAAARLHDAIDAVAIDVQQTQAAELTLHNEQVQAQAALAELENARAAAQSALGQDQTLLTQAQANLAVLVAVVERLSAEEEEEEDLAKAFNPNPVAFALNQTPGSYANPLRAINDLYPERVDQWVDYSGYGPIFAVGDGVILSTTNSGWPGGTFIAYRLSDGPAGGLVVYAGEDIDPQVSVGESVNVDTVLGTMYEGPDGIETGWADSSGDGLTMARDAGQFSGANSTAFGANFSQLLASLGAPPGVMQNNPATGSLPAGWPSW